MEPVKPEIAAAMPRRFTIIASILLGVFAAAQAARAFYGLDMAIGGYHVPVAVSWAVAAVTALVALLAFREADT